jgi:hypothetical protein
MSKRIPHTARHALASHAITVMEASAKYTKGIFDVLLDDRYGRTDGDQPSTLLGEDLGWVVRLVESAQGARVREPGWRAELIEIAEELFGTEGPS